MTQLHTTQGFSKSCRPNKTQYMMWPEDRKVPNPGLALGLSSSIHIALDIQENPTENQDFGLKWNHEESPLRSCWTSL